MLASQGSDGKSDITPLTPFELGAQKANKNYYGYLLLLSFVSFGGHFARSSLSIFGLYFIRDEFISPAGLGMFLSACSLPSMFLPLMVGYLIDKTKQVKAVTMTLLGMTVGGLILFSFAVYIRSFSLAMLALIIFGSGSSSIMAIQRMLITVYLRGNETFTTGFYIALANISKLLGKITIAPSEAAFDSYQLALLLPIFACVLSFASYLLFTWSYDEASDCGVAKKVPCSCKEDNVPCRKATRAMEEVLSSIDIVHYHPSMASMPSVEADVEEAVTLDIGDDLDGHLSGSHMKQGGSDARNGGSTLLNGKSNSPHDAPSPNGFSKQVVLKSSESGGSYKVIKSGPSAPLNFKSKSAKQSESTKPSASSGQGSGAHPNGGSITVPIALKRVYSQVDQPDSRDESEQSSLLSHSALPTRYGGAQTVHALEPPPAGSDHLAHEPRRRRQFTFCCWGRYSLIIRIDRERFCCVSFDLI